MAYRYNQASKYNAIKTEIDGFIFDSKREARRYSELALLEKAGEIRSLCLQPVFPIVINGKKICKYIADFKYITNAGRIVVEDAKGVKTKEYRIKKKLVKAVYGFDVVEV